MKIMLKSALLAGIALACSPQIALAKNDNAESSPFASKKDKDAQPAPAASSGGVRGAGLAIADLDGVMASADANRSAQQQRPVTYKAQIDSYQSRGQQIQAQLKPMIDKFNRDQQAPSAKTPAGQASLQQQATAIQQIQENAQRELNEIIKPVAYSEAYVNEQIEDKLDQAVKNAMAANRVTILIKPDGILASENSYNLSGAILAELNKLIPNAQLVPPQGWEPRQIREARAAQAAQQQQGARPAAPAGPSTDGR